MISLCMIVKNEIKYIEDCLKAVAPFVDEIIVVDTGSTDGTLAILEQFDCKVYEFAWCDDYAKARNYSVSKASNDWILFLDADEHITEFDKTAINQFIKKNMSNCIGMISLKSYVGDLTNTSIDRLPRLFNKKKFQFIRPIHEYLNPTDKNITVATCDIPIFADHFGYLDSTTTDKDKNNKYIETLTKSLNTKYDPYLEKHLAAALFNIKEYDEAIKKCDNVLSQKNAKSFDYYSEVVTLRLEALIALKNFEEAVKMESYFESCKDDDKYLYTMSIAYIELNFNETALDIYEYLLNKKDLSINRLQVIFAIGELMFNCGVYDEAYRWYNMLPSAPDINEKMEICEKNLNS